MTDIISEDDGEFRSAMYGHHEDAEEAAIMAVAPRGLNDTQLGAMTTIEALSAVVRAQQKIIAQQTQDLRRLHAKIENLTRVTRKATGDIDRLWNDMDRKVDRRD